MDTVALSPLDVWFQMCHGGFHPALGAANPVFQMALDTDAMDAR